MALPVFRAAGAKSTATTGAVTVSAPSGVATGDLEILIAECATANTVSITTNGGGSWTAMTGSPITVAAGEKLYVWSRIRAGGDSDPQVTASADHVCAGRLAYQTGTFNTVDPFEVETTSTETTSDTSFSWAPGVSTAGTDRLVLCISSILRDSNVASVPVCTNASLSALNSRANYCTNSGNGGGFGVTEGARAASGSVGTFACTYAAASPKSMIAFAIKPLVSYTLTADVGTFTLTGNDANFTRPTRILPSDVGAFDLTGIDATLRREPITMPADVGAFALTGNDATLDYIGGSPPDILDENFEGTGAPSGWGNSGSVEYDSTASPLEGAQSLRINRALSAFRSAYIEVGEFDEVWGHFMFRPEQMPGTYDDIFDTYNPAFGYPFRIRLLSSGELRVLGPGINDTTSGALSVSTNYHIWWHFKKGTGSNAVAEVWYSTTDTRPGSGGSDYAGATNGTETTGLTWISIAGQEVGSGTGVIGSWDTVQAATTDIFGGAVGGGTLTADVGAFALTGNDASLLRSLKITADVGAFALTGNDAGLLWARRLTADVGAFALTGNVALLQQTHIMAAAVGAFVLTGNAAALRFYNNLLTNLTSYWKLDEDGSADRVDSHDILDLDVSGSSLGSDTGKIGNAAEFVADSVFLGEPTFKPTVADEDFTISGWFKASSNPNSTLRYLFGKGNHTNSVEYCLFFTSGLRFRIGDGAANYQEVSDAIGSSTGWNFVVAWHDSVADEIWIQINNGTPVSASWNLGCYEGGNYFTIGKDLSGGDANEEWEGLVDEVAFWKRVLSENDRTALWNGGDGLPYEQFTETGAGVFTLTAETGAFALTGNAATLARQITLSAAAGSFALTGNAAVLTQTHRMVADTGAFALTGNDATLRLNQVLAAATGAFALTGNDATLRLNQVVAASAGAFVLTGIDAALRQTQIMVSSVGAFALTGNDATLKRSLRLAADTGAVVLTGNIAALRTNRSLSASVGTFTLTGNNAGLSAGKTVVASVGSFVLTGNDATFLLSQALTAATGAFNVTGNAATFLRSLRLAANTGAFVVTGNAASLSAGKILVSSTGAFVLTGNAAALRRSSILTSAAGAFVLTGNAATMSKAVTLSGQVGAFILTGNGASLTRSVTLFGQTGTFTLAGNDAGKLRTYILTSGTGAFILTGNDATLVWQEELTLSATVGHFLVTGNDAALTQTSILASDTGAFVLAGNDAALKLGFRLLADTGSFAVVGNDAGFLRTYIFSAAVGTFILTGNAATLNYTVSGQLAANTGVFLFTGNAASLRVSHVLPALTKQFTFTGKDASLRHTHLLAAGLGAYAFTGNPANLDYSSSGASKPAFFITEEIVLQGSGIGGGFI